MNVPTEPTENGTISQYYRAVSVTFSSICAESSKMRSCVEKARKAAALDVTVLLLGENGTGKNLLAQAIHNASPRLGRPFEAVNCSAIAPPLLESELFGHEKGALTSAIRRKKGRFELAHSGTMFLDEIGELAIEAQVKILRAVEYKVFERVGGEETIHSDVRLIAATNKDPGRLIEEGRLREDLFFRLNEFSIVIPPLRERKDEIPSLLDMFIQELSTKFGKDIRKVSKSAQQLLMEHDWPGNIRELRSVLKRAYVMSPGKVVDVEHLGLTPVKLDAPSIDQQADLSLKGMEQRHIRRVLRYTGWNKKKTCELLKISRPTLDRKIEEYGLRKETETRRD